MMAALSGMTAGKQPTAANAGRVATQDCAAGDADVLLSVEAAFASLLEDEPPLLGDGVKAVSDEVAEGESLADELQQANPVHALLVEIPAAADDADSESASATAVDEVLPAGERMLPVGLSLSSRLTAGSLSLLSQSIQATAAEGATQAMAQAGEAQSQAAEPLTGELAVTVEADKLLKTELSHVVSGEGRTLSSSLLALGVPALREASADSRVEWAAVPVVPQTEGGKPQALQQLLAERLAVQSSHGMDRALIRLDPPRFGALEISLQQEGGRLLVQLSASHGEVVRQLQGIGDVLRQELGQRQFHTVQVDIRHSMHDGQQQGGRQQSQQQAEPGRALQLDEEGNFAASYAAEDMQA